MLYAFLKWFRKRISTKCRCFETEGEFVGSRRGGLFKESSLCIGCGPSVSAKTRAYTTGGMCLRHNTAASLKQ